MVAIERRRQGEARMQSSGEIAPTECPSRAGPVVVWSLLSAGVAGFVGYNLYGAIHEESHRWGW